MNTGENIRRRRRNVGLTQWELSQKVGIRQGSLLLIERGQAVCSKQLLERIAKALDVRVSDLRKPQ